MLVKKIMLVVLGLCLPVLVGCQMPFSTADQVDDYLSQVEPVFTSSQNTLNDIGGDIKIDNFSKSNLQDNVDLLDQAISQEQNRQKTINDLSVPEPASDLAQDLKSYYQTEVEALTEIKNLFSYLKEANPYIDKPANYVDRLENLEYSSNNELTNKVENIANQADKDLSKLKEIEVNKSTEQYHKQFVKLYKAMADFLDELVQAINDEDLEQIDSAATRLENISSDASNAFTDLKFAQKFSQYAEELTSLESEINSSIKELKLEYNLN